MGTPVTRRRFIQASAAAAATTAFEPGAFAQRPDGPNVLLVIVDSLRSDAVYEPWVRTPNMTALAREGLRFTNAFPEAMPTVPARNSILSGRRQFPFRGWYDRRGLIEAPGWEPLANVDGSLLSVLRRAGWWTSYVTDNPFLGFAPPYAPLRNSVNRFVRTGGQIGGTHSVSSVPDRILRHWLHPANDGAKTRRRVGLYLANSRPWEGPDNTFAGRVFHHALQELNHAAARRGPFALVVDTYEPHEPWTPPPRFLDGYGDWRGREPAMPHYGRAENWLGPGERGRVIGRMRDLYAAEVTMTDHFLGMLLNRLHDLNLERETVIALVSDHGILLGEHGWTGKVQTALYPALTRVPLVLVDPRRRRAGHDSEWFASTHDLAPTILSMAGVRRPERMTGVDLSRPFRGRRLPTRDYAWGGYSDSFFIRSRDWMLWGYNRPGNLKLFDLRRDPGQFENVAARHPAIVRLLYGKLLQRAGGRLPWYGGL
ncbi:MAG TPA: sulfatase [Thermoleophilaceae bacterium]|nr:sulfatase [Thermoleophilaceae bacterium]